jgi:hypothetical protein
LMSCSSMVFRNPRLAMTVDTTVFCTG